MTRGSLDMEARYVIKTTCLQRRGSSMIERQKLTEAEHNRDSNWENQLRNGAFLVALDHSMFTGGPSCFDLSCSLRSSGAISRNDS